MLKKYFWTSSKVLYSESVISETVFTEGWLYVVIVGLSPGLAIFNGSTRLRLWLDFWRRAWKIWSFFYSKKKEAHQARNWTFLKSLGSVLGLAFGPDMTHHYLVLCNIQEEALHSLVWNELILNPSQSYKTGIILVAMQCY